MLFLNMRIQRVIRFWKIGHNSVRIIFKRSISVSRRHHAAPLQYSYTQGAGDVPLRGATIGSLLQEQAEKTPDREAVVFCADGVRRTFSQLLAESDRLAAGLLTLGLQKGDRVGIWGPNSLEWILAQYATARAGLILVQCRALISAVKFKEQDYYDILFQLIPEMASQNPGNIHSHVLPDLKHVIMMGEDQHPGTWKLSDVMNAGSDSDIRNIPDLQRRLQFDEPINIQFTSGTTGFPKGATLTHHNIVNNSYFIGLTLDYHNRGTRICIPVPLYHCFGMVIGSLQMVNHGATCVFPSPGFDRSATLKAVQSERCTSLYGVPTMFIDMLNHHDFDTFDLSSLYTGVMAGSPCPIETMRQVIAKMHMDQVTVCYGTTENSPVTFQSHRDDVIEKRVSTVGRAHPHVEAKIIDEDGHVVPVGTSGELCTRGYVVMLGYWKDEARTRETILPDRWYKTGDQAVMDEKGFVRITGRIKDMIIRGGENIYPLEIEQVLYTHPKIQDVQVVGVPDKRLGEQICAWVILKEGQTATEQEIQAFCKEKVARFKVPKYVQFVTEFPLTVTGKVQKYKIREAATRSLGLEHVT
ncbi:medium-chain acyl-CoA ligase ACSF2, mitochondrial-like isoform X2 [Dreissena polymorpha]|uniref:medium-chain acyl-CoA ligase ACSF2, mitochondrial-like isoform X2 n=1 Tax=Dreissena polymorpha TaxID=45954 RepID=UPI00226536F6|nr:medium-chain acyl-CoA ligase ACSF2, mitochondrial-like isoform X2 [Dreissena polymorpha]